jgi:hypothetical protein
MNRVLVGKLEKEGQLAISWCRWEDNINMELEEVDGRARARLIWFGIATCGGKVEFYTIREIA